MAVAWAAAALAGCADEPRVAQQPEIVQEPRHTIPAHGAVDVTLHDSIVITFAGSMDRARTEAAVEIWPAATLQFGWSRDARQLWISPQHPYGPATWPAPGATYHMTIDRDAADVAGNRLASSFSFSFTMARYPTVIRTSPADLTTGLDSSIDTNIVVVFSESMQRAIHKLRLSESSHRPLISGSTRWSTTHVPDDTLIHTIGGGTFTPGASYSFALECANLDGVLSGLVTIDFDVR